MALTLLRRLDVLHAIRREHDQLSRGQFENDSLELLIGRRASAALRPRRETTLLVDASAGDSVHDCFRASRIYQDTYVTTADGGGGWDWMLIELALDQLDSFFYVDASKLDTHFGGDRCHRYLTAVRVTHMVYITFFIW